jgi:hypothetical protein
MGNDDVFRGHERQRTYLAARGFDAMGSRAGGIIDPTEVVLPLGAVLIRLFSAGNAAQGYGEWWNTPHEIRQVIEHVGVDGRVLASAGKTGRNGWLVILALLPWWNDADRFHVVRLSGEMHAWHGEGDEAKGRRNSDRPLVPPRIVDRLGRQRRVRQLFIPEFRFRAAFTTPVCGDPAPASRPPEATA